MLPLLGANHLLPLFHMAKSFICLEEAKERINDFFMRYTINQKLNINKAFREQVDKCMKTTFGATTKSYIRSTLAKYTTRVLALLMFYETRQNPKKAFKVLSCVIYTIISNYDCIDYQTCE